jgi:hypothetical protein
MPFFTRIPARSVPPVKSSAIQPRRAGIGASGKDEGRMMTQTDQIKKKRR